jgi:xanthine dehydrogenase YagT iron-sulfur-binding subunit
MEEDHDERRTPKDCACGSAGLSRRGFIATIGTSAVAAAAAATAATAATAPAPPAAPVEMVKVTLSINGRAHRLMVEPRWSLLYVIREQLGMTATKLGCERGECGVCTVLIDGKPRYACMTLAVEAEGLAVTTLEGLMNGEELGPVQQAFAEEDAFQCGYCTPGQIMAVEGLLRANPQPTLDDVRLGVSGNLCRCGTYPLIFKAAQRAAELRKQRTS